MSFLTSDMYDELGYEAYKKAAEDCREGLRQKYLSEGCSEAEAIEEADLYVTAHLAYAEGRRCADATKH